MAFDRRGILLGLLSCPLCAASTRAAEEAHWSYSGEGGPDHWGALNSAYKACSAGTEQSPIDLDRAIRADIARLNVDWKPQAYRVANNGHTIQANATPGSAAILGKESYALLQFHFHTPSEHALHGKRFAMEAHFVHARRDGQLVVIGVFMESGGKNEAFSAVMAAAPRKEGEQPLQHSVDPRQFLPKKTIAFRYQGSLTTPPCSETVTWIVYNQPISVAEADIAAFKAIFPMDARPLQRLNRRYLLIGR